MKKIKSNFNELPDLLDAEMISEYLGLSYNSTLRLIKYNMEYLKLGRYYRVTKDNFSKFLNNNVKAMITPN